MQRFNSALVFVIIIKYRLTHLSGRCLSRAASLRDFGRQRPQQLCNGILWLSVAVLWLSVAVHWLSVAVLWLSVSVLWLSVAARWLFVTALRLRSLPITFFQNRQRCCALTCHAEVLRRCYKRVQRPFGASVPENSVQWVRDHRVGYCRYCYSMIEQTIHTNSTGYYTVDRPINNV